MSAVAPDRNGVNDIAPRVRHLEVEVAGIRDDQKLVFGKLDQISVAIAQLQAGRPALGAMDAVRTGLAIMQTLVLLVGAGVASIVYVSSNANNGTTAVMQERLGVMQQRVQQLELNAGWAPRVSRQPGS